MRLRSREFTTKNTKSTKGRTTDEHRWTPIAKPRGRIIGTNRFRGVARRFAAKFGVNFGVKFGVKFGVRSKRTRRMVRGIEALVSSGTQRELQDRLHERGQDGRSRNCESRPDRCGALEFGQEGSILGL